MKKIVVVDDEYDIAEAVQSLLQSEGYDVDVFQDGASALAGLTGRSGAALLLVDMMMPRLDGLRLVEALRREPGYAQVPMIMMSALRPKEGEGSIGWNAFLQKPFSFGALMRLVVKHIGRP